MRLPTMAMTLAAAFAQVVPAVHAAAEAEEKAPPVIDLDGTVLVQFAIFVVMYLLLRTLLFKPYMQMRTLRSTHIEGAEHQAEEMQRRAAELEEEHQQRLAQARSRADEERVRLQGEGRAREAELLTQAREKAQTQLQQARQRLAAQVAAVQEELMQRAEPLAHKLASKLLGREV